MNIVTGIVSYGLWDKTIRCLKSFSDELSEYDEVIIIDANPDDPMPPELLATIPDQVTVYKHMANMGFPFSINDLMEEAFVERGADYLFIMGNDTILAPGTWTEMVLAVEHSGIEFLFAEEMKVAEFQRRHPHAELNAFGEIYHSKSEGEITPNEYITGFHNCSLISRHYFEKVGYVDTGFYPAYFEDLDYVKRGRLADMDHFKLKGSFYLHDESSTIRSQMKQKKANSNRYFRLNEGYYRMKWGSLTHGNEKYNIPFAGLRDIPLGGLRLDGEYFQNGLRENGERSIAKEMQLARYFATTPKQLKNRFAGRRAIVCCNGASLNDVDFDAIPPDVLVVALNRGYMHEKLQVRADIAVAVNPNIFDQWGHEFCGAHKDILKFIPRQYDEYFRAYDDVYGLIFHPGERFNSDIDTPIWQGHTVTFVALQVLAYLGVVDVAIVGMNHEYFRDSDKPTNTTTEAIGLDVDHFSPLYFPQGSTWDTPNLGKSEEAYEMANEWYLINGGQVFNCSTRTKCNVFTIKKLEDWL